MSGLDIEELKSRVGRAETRRDVITAAPVAHLSAMLDYGHSLAQKGESLPPGWHWLYFLEAVPASALDTDGHAKRGGFMPPVPLPRRMWAGSRLRFLAPLIVGDEARRVTTIADVQHKQGRSGELVFLSLLHQVFCGDRLAVEEEQDLVYRGELALGAADKGPSPPAAPHWTREIEPDPVLLFRYSALTFNSHRIHYDRDYATGTEGYESLVVQGPLTATLLLDLLQREVPDARARTFQFRAIRPLLEGSTLTLQGRREGERVLLWALDDNGALAMEAHVSLAKLK